MTSPAARPTVLGTRGTGNINTALEYAMDQARLAPSVHNTQPWTFVLHPDRLEVRADRTRQLTALDPRGRELLQSVGAAVLNARVALSARGFAVSVHRLPDDDDTELMAVINPVNGSADPDLARLDPMIKRRRTNRRSLDPVSLIDVDLDRLRRLTARENAVVVPLTRKDRQVVGALTRLADRVQNANPAYRAELRRWTTRTSADGDGILATAVPHVTGVTSAEIPLRDFDTQGIGGLPADPQSTDDQTLLLLATPGDDPRNWLRSGEVSVAMRKSPRVARSRSSLVAN